jgi:hypothetical protein
MQKKYLLGVGGKKYSETVPIKNSKISDFFIGKVYKYCQAKKTTNFLPQSLIGKNLCFMENIGAWGKKIGKFYRERPREVARG